MAKIPPQGTHYIGRFHRADGDERRHSHRCSYYKKETGECRIIVLKCKGAAHCEYYTENEIKAIKESSSTVSCRISFDGIKYVPLRNIYTFGKKYNLSRKEKASVREFYRTYKKLDKPIIVERMGNSTYKLLDNCLQYELAKELNLDIVPICCSPKDAELY